MPTVVSLMLLLLVVTSATAQDRLQSPYRHQAESGLRGLNANEIAELRAGTGMGLARAAELNGYPGPRHVLDAVQASQFQAPPEQVQRVQKIFDEMNRDAQRVGAQILEEEQRLEAAFQSAAMTDADLRSRVMRIADLRGELRVIHLRAHLATRATLSDAQVARYNELRGYTTPHIDHQGAAARALTEAAVGLMPEITPARVEFLLVDLATGVTLAQDLQSLITSGRAALPDEPA